MRLGRTPEQFADDLVMSTHYYAAREAGRAKLTKEEARMVAYALDVQDREDAVEAAGIPRCPVAARFAEEVPGDALSAEFKQFVADAERHCTQCESCIARDRFLRERFPDLVMPQSPWMRVLGRYMAWVERRPDWLRPAIHGAVMLAVITLGRGAFVLLFGGFRQPRVIGMVFGAALVAATAGAAGGLVYGLVGRPLRQLPVAGPYLAGVVAAAGYLFAVFSLMAVIDGSGAEGTDMSFGLLAGVSVVLGMAIGHFWFRPKDAANG